MEHSSHHHNSPLTRLKRRATYLLALIVVVAGGYLVLSAWGDYSLTGFTAGVPGTEAPENFAVSAVLTLPESGLDVSDVTLKITLSSAEEIFSGGTLSVDGLNMESFQGASVVLNGYDGSVVSNGDGFLQLDGKAISAIVNNVVVNKDGKPITVETHGLQFDSATVSGVSVKSFSLVSTGTVDVAGKGSFSVQNEKIDLKSFNGIVEIDASGLKLTGTTSKLVIASTPRVSIE